MLHHVYTGPAALTGRMHSHVQGTRQQHREIQTLLFGFSTVRPRRLGRMPWYRSARLPRAARPEVAVVGWGNAMAGAGSVISRSGTGPVRALPDLAARQYRRHFFLDIDEHNTSKVCANCLSSEHKGKFTVPRSGVPGWRLQQCKSRTCKGAIYNRDPSAATNMLSLTLNSLFCCECRGLVALERRGARRSG